MADYFIGEIRLFAFEFAPENWAKCNGAAMSIQQNQALYALLGTTFGGDGSKTFNLPDFQGRAPAHPRLGKGGTPLKQGDKRGLETVALETPQLPKHRHRFLGAPAAANTNTGANTALAVAQPDVSQAKSRPIYGTDGPYVALDPGSLRQSGGGTGHTNMQPFATLNFCIAIHGIYPPGIETEL